MPILIPTILLSSAPIVYYSSAYKNSGQANNCGASQSGCRHRVPKEKSISCKSELHCDSYESEPLPYPLCGCDFTFYLYMRCKKVLLHFACMLGVCLRHGEDSFCRSWQDFVVALECNGVW